MIKNKIVRILAIAPTARGFGYVVMEGPRRLVTFSNKSILQNKNERTLVWVEKFIRRYEPAVMVLPAVCMSWRKFTPLFFRLQFRSSRHGVGGF